MKRGAASARWTDGQLLSGTAADGTPGIQNFCFRLEYQDGKRKEATQQYHGREAVHLHAIFFGTDAECLHLERTMKAEVPPHDHPLRGFILDGQASRTGSGLEVREEPSVFDKAAGTVRLRHKERDEALGIRAYQEAEVEVLKCHVDNLFPRTGADGRGLLMRYVTTYAPKFSDSFATEWLADEGSTGYGMALRILSCYHPGEPEMWLTLATQMLPPFGTGGTVQQLVAPWPDMPRKRDCVALYKTSRWRGDDMSLLEFLRKSNKAGDIVQWVKKAHARSGTQESLEAFARNCPMAGEKIIAAELVSPFSDKFFGQWLMLHRPFRKVEDLLVREILEKVPDRYKFFGCARALCPEYWQDEQRIREDLLLAARGDVYIENALSMLRAQASLVDRYLSGAITLEDEAQAPQARPAAAGARAERIDPGLFTLLQTTLRQHVMTNVDLVLQLRAAETEEEAETLMSDFESNGRILAGLGPPGTGKTVVADRCIEEAVAKGARVLYALPTGQLAAQMRVRHPEIQVDTCHGAFWLHRPRAEAVAALTEYDFVVVDEVFQLTCEHFDRIWEMFNAAGRAVCLLLLGDPWQLPTIDGEAPDSHWAWKDVLKIKFQEVKRCKCPVLARKQAAIRSHKPMGQAGKQLVALLCRDHKAWTGHHGPTDMDVASVLQRTSGETTFITCTRRGAALLNTLAAEVLFERNGQRPLGQVPIEYENPENYDVRGKLIETRAPLAAQLVLYRGARVVLTRNLNKPEHFVNGMVATIEDFDAAAGSIVVRTVTNRRLSIHRYTDDAVPRGRCVYYPLRLGYAGTVYKYQGATLAHVTLWLDRPGCPAAAYVALTRVERDEDYLIGGIVETRHILPAR